MTYWNEDFDLMNKGLRLFRTIPLAERTYSDEDFDLMNKGLRRGRHMGDKNK